MKLRGRLSPGRDLHRSHSRRCQADRSAGPAAHNIRAGRYLKTAKTLGFTVPQWILARETGFHATPPIQGGAAQIRDPVIEEVVGLCLERVGADRNNRVGQLDVFVLRFPTAAGPVGAEPSQISRLLCRLRRPRSPHRVRTVGLSCQCHRGAAALRARSNAPRPLARFSPHSKI
jgi:hypothetical protein